MRKRYFCHCLGLILIYVEAYLAKNIISSGSEFKFRPIFLTSGSENEHFEGISYVSKTHKGSVAEESREYLKVRI